MKGGKSKGIGIGESHVIEVVHAHASRKPIGLAELNMPAGIKRVVVCVVNRVPVSVERDRRVHRLAVLVVRVKRNACKRRSSDRYP